MEDGRVAVDAVAKIGKRTRPHRAPTAGRTAFVGWIPALTAGFYALATPARGFVLTAIGAGLWQRASPLLSQEAVQRDIVEHRVGPHALQRGVFILQSPQPPGLGHVHPAGLGLPLVEAGVADRVFAARIRASLTARVGGPSSSSAHQRPSADGERLIRGGGFAHPSRSRQFPILWTAMRRKHEGKRSCEI